jgi:2,3-dihydro-2,3-dihydroxybenzoate dehydrogenase
MSSPFRGQTAMVTGGAQGIGAAVVRALAGGGAQVAAVDVNEVAVCRLAHRLTACGRRVVGHAGDVRHTSAVEELVAAVERDLGPIAILVNVAGVLRTGPVTEMTDDDWRTVFEVNAGGVFRVSRAVARRMVPRRSGCIITVGSNAAGVPRMHMAGYAAAKAAAMHFTRCLGLELAGYGIRCNVVAPGSTDTDMLRSMWTSPADADRVLAGSLDLHRTGIPLGRLGRPEDIADAVLFLASDRARHITMHDLYVDGGAALRA